MAEYHALSIPCPLKGKRAACFAMENGRCRLLKQNTRKNPCKFYKPKQQYEEEIKAADKRSYDSTHNNGVRSWGKIEWGDSTHERKKSKAVP